MATPGIWRSPWLQTGVQVRALHPAGETEGAPEITYKKNPEAVTTFQENFSTLLQEKRTESRSMLQPPVARPVRVFCLDESRFGLLPIQRRCITLTGVKPLGAVQYRFENFYVYGAAEPTTGESFFREVGHEPTSRARP
jgi:hypothetical protein